MWQEDPLSEHNGYYYHKTNSPNVYYEIIDENATIVEGTYKIEGAELNRQSNYVYKDGYIYWSTADGRSKKITVHTLAINVPKPDFTLGDVDEDGSITTADASMVLKYYVGIIKENELSNNQKLAADVNFDENTTTADASQILKYYVGMIHNF